jgi:hypothetical protein
MKESTFVPESWSSNRVPEVIQNIHRVPIEFPKLSSGIGFRTLHFLLVISQSKIKKGKIKWIKENRTRKSS